MEDDDDWLASVSGVTGAGGVRSVSHEVAEVVADAIVPLDEDVVAPPRKHVLRHPSKRTRVEHALARACSTTAASLRTPISWTQLRSSRKSNFTIWKEMEHPRTKKDRCFLGECATRCSLERQSLREPQQQLD